MALPALRGTRRSHVLGGNVRCERQHLRIGTQLTRRRVELCRRPEAMQDFFIFRSIAAECVSSNISFRTDFSQTFILTTLKPEGFGELRRFGQALGITCVAIGRRCRSPILARKCAAAWCSVSASTSADRMKIDARSNPPRAAVAER